MENNLTVSPPPHFKSAESTKNIMLDVIIALIPASAASVIFFGYRSAILIVCCILCAVLSEYIFRKCMKKEITAGDLSAVVTGLIFALNLPPSLPLWMAAPGSIIAIVVIKQLFGGIGRNFVNPAIGAKIILMLSFSGAMTAWDKPFSWIERPFDIFASAPLGSNAATPSLFDMFIGNRGGNIGEICIPALLLGGLYLVVRKIIQPTVPAVFIGTVFCLSLISTRDLTAALTLCMSGSVFFGAIFMATDYTTSPITTKGKLVFAFGCGIITFVIRQIGILPEGVPFAIATMNISAPYIDKIFRKRRKSAF